MNGAAPKIPATGSQTVPPKKPMPKVRIEGSATMNRTTAITPSRATTAIETIAVRTSK